MCMRHILLCMYLYYWYLYACLQIAHVSEQQHVMVHVLLMACRQSPPGKPEKLQKFIISGCQFTPSYMKTEDGPEIQMT